MTHVAIISAGRPGQVPVMERHCAGLDPVWYVPADQVGDYLYAGAGNVVEAGALCPSRNQALDAADSAGVDCLQLSDDLKRIGWAHGNTRDTVEALSVADALARLAAAAKAEGAQLAGAAPTDNPYFAKQRVHRSAFIVGDLTYTTAGCALRYDERLRLKEDYDYTCQHLAAVGCVARIDQLLASFAHRTNKGGAVAVRTPELEQEAIALLQAKWPDAIKPNGRRENEVLLRWK